MAKRLEALEGKFLEYGPSRLDFAALISKLAMLNFAVKALTDALVSNLKHFQENMQLESKLDVDKTLAANTSTRNTIHPPRSLSEPEGAERIRYYTQVHFISWSKEVGRVRSPPHLVFNMEGPLSNNVHSPPTNVDAAPTGGEAGGSTSLVSDYALISPPAKTFKYAPTLKRKPTSNA